MTTAFFQKPYELNNTLQLNGSNDIEWAINKWETDSDLQEAMVSPLPLWVYIYMWLFLNHNLDGAFVITKCWNEATLAILSLKKQDEAIGRWKVLALWLQALKVFTLLHIGVSTKHRYSSFA